MPTSRRELITARARSNGGSGDYRRDGRHGSVAGYTINATGTGEVCGEAPQRAVFHWISVTGERRLRFNYRTNLRFDRASVSRQLELPSRGNDEGPRRPDAAAGGRNGLEKWGERERNHCNEISATPAVSFYGHRCYGKGSVSIARARAFPPRRLLLADRCR